MKMVNEYRKSCALRKKDFVEFSLYSEGQVSIGDVMKMPYSYRQFVYSVLNEREKAKHSK